MNEKIKWVYPVFFMVLCLISLSVYFFGHSFNRCNMTYMYQYPEYIEVSMTAQVKKRFPNYRLMVYGEGMYADYLRSMELSGIPVLFIPGNAGSYRQVRSLGSIALMKSGKNSHLPEFNFFSIDFDEELSGLFGQYLITQTNFAKECVDRILKLYTKARNPPKQVILIGHSVGGIVAEMLLALPNVKTSVFPLILTLATPNRSPVMNFDPLLTNLHAAVLKSIQHNAEILLSKSIFFSIGGGYQDTLVRSELTQWPSHLRKLVVPAPEAVNKSRKQLILMEQTTTAMDFVWASTDHLCIVWCNQVVLRIVRSLFDMVDRKTEQISRNQSVILESLFFHLISNPGVKSVTEATTWKDPHMEFGNMKESRPFTNDFLQVYTTSPKALPTILYTQFVSSSMIGSSIYVLTTQQIDAILFVCDLENGCGQGKAAVHHKVTAVDSRFIHFKLTPELEGYTIAVPTYFHSSRKLVVIKKYNENLEANVDAVDFSITDLFRIYPVYTRKLSGELGFFNLTFSGLSSLFQVYSIALEPLNCKLYANDEISSVFVEFPAAPLGNLHRYFRYPYNASDDLLVHIQEAGVSGAGIAQVLLNPGCVYELRIASASFQGFAQVLRHFPDLIPGLITVQLLILISAHDENGNDMVKHHVFYLAYQFFLLIGSGRPGVDVPVSLSLCSISSGLFFIGYLLCLIICSILQSIGRGLRRLRSILRRQNLIETEAKTSDSDEAYHSIRTKKDKHADSISKETKKQWWTDHQFDVFSFTFALVWWILNPSFIPGHIILFASVAAHAILLIMNEEDSESTINYLRLECHLLTIAFLLPSFIGWTKLLVNGHGLSNFFDPSRMTTICLVLAALIPVPQFFQRFRFVIPVFMVILSYNMDNVLSSLAECLGLVSGIYLNRSFVKSEKKAKLA